MGELWYAIAMSVAGLLILAGIILTWAVSRRCGRASRWSSALLLTGGATTAVGFSWVVLGEATPERWLVMTLILAGPAMIGCALSEMGFKGVSGRFLIQSALTLLSLSEAGHYLSRQMDIAYAGPFLAVLLLMNAQITTIRGTKRELLIAASWTIVLFAWTRYLLNHVTGLEKAALIGPYLAAIVTWVAVLITLYRAPPMGADQAELARKPYNPVEEA